MRKVAPAVVLAVSLAAFPVFAMDTDDPGTVAPKSVEIEISGEYAKSAEGGETGSEPRRHDGDPTESRHRPEPPLHRHRS